MIPSCHCPKQNLNKQAATVRRPTCACCLLGEVLVELLVVTGSAGHGHLLALWPLSLLVVEVIGHPRNCVAWLPQAGLRGQNRG